MSREIITIKIESVDDVTLSMQTQFTAEQMNQSLANTEIARLLHAVRAMGANPFAAVQCTDGKVRVRKR